MTPSLRHSSQTAGKNLLEISQRKRKFYGLFLIYFLMPISVTKIRMDKKVENRLEKWLISVRYAGGDLVWNIKMLSISFAIVVSTYTQYFLHFKTHLNTKNVLGFTHSEEL